MLLERPALSLSVDRTQTRHYADGERRCFSVSQVCREMTGDIAYGDAASMQRGTDLHMIFALSVASFAGNSPPPVIPMPYQGYVASLQAWIDRAKPEPVKIESPAVSAVKTLPYAGTPDLLAWVWYCGKRRLAIVDLKTGQATRTHPIQLMAYSKLDGYQDADLLLLLYVYEDGSEPTVKAVKHNPRDWVAYQAALALLTWRHA